MKNTFGNSVAVTLFGESHGPAVGAVLDGIAPGIPVDEDSIARYLQKRRPVTDVSTARREPDEFHIFSGVYNGKTTGTPLCILIRNVAQNTAAYTEHMTVPRPGHADYTAQIKYGGYADPRGGGHFSGRLTAALVAVGGILQDALRRKGIEIGTHILRCHGIGDAEFSDYDSELQNLKSAAFPVLDVKAGERMRAEIRAAAANGNSVGGIVQTAVLGLPAGIGEPWFDTVESMLSHALFSIPAIKGVEFGDGFAFADKAGAEVSDGFISTPDGIRTEFNHNGGINGGISNGMPIVFQCAVKPTPSIAVAQKSIDLTDNRALELSVTGRHDPAIVHRICPVIDAMTAVVLCDLLAAHYGTDWLAEPR